MASKLFNTRVQLKVDTATNWANKPSANKLLAGEVAIVKEDTDVVKLKVGDGSTAAISSLPTISPDSLTNSEIEDITNS